MIKVINNLNESAKRIPVDSITKLISQIEELQNQLKSVVGYNTNYEEALKDTDPNSATEGYGALIIHKVIVDSVVSSGVVLVKRISTNKTKNEDITSTLEKMPIKTLLQYDKDYDQVKKEVEVIYKKNYENHLNPELYTQRGIDSFKSKYKDSKSYVKEYLDILDKIDKIDRV